MIKIHITLKNTNSHDTYHMTLTMIKNIFDPVSCKQLYLINDNFSNEYCTSIFVDCGLLYTDEIEEAIDKYLLKIYPQHNWLLVEYKEYPKLTRYEFETLQRMKNQGYSWITRGIFDYIDLFFDKPKKINNCWNTTLNKSWSSNIYDLDFQFIEQTDKEPWNIQELLENCEVEN